MKIFKKDGNARHKYWVFQKTFHVDGDVSDATGALVVLVTARYERACYSAIELASFGKHCRSERLQIDVAELTNAERRETNMALSGFNVYQLLLPAAKKALRDAALAFCRERFRPKFKERDYFGEDLARKQRQAKTKRRKKHGVR